MDSSGLTTLIALLAVGYVTADLFTRLVRRFALHFELVDLPGERKIHSRPVPRFGGLAIYLAVHCSLSAGLLLSPHYLGLATLAAKPLLAIFLGGLFVLLLGAADDYWRLSAAWKLFFQVVISLIPILGGVVISGFTVPSTGVAIDFFELNRVVGILLTVLWTAGLMNALNFIDGADGLLSGVCTIAALVLGMVSMHHQQYLVAGAFFTIMGSCLGFLRHNSYPASIFCGDSGSLFLGYMFATLTVYANIKSTALSSFLLPVLALGLPIFDSLATVAIRALRGIPVAQPGRDHLHHKLMRLGYSQRTVGRFFYAIALVLGLLTLFMMNRSDEFATLCVVMVTLAIFTLSRQLDVLFERRQERLMQQLGHLPEQLTAVGAVPPPGSAGDPPAAPPPSVTNPAESRREDGPPAASR